MIVGAEAIISTEIAQLCGRGHSTGRLSVDVDVEPAVDGSGAGTPQLLVYRRPFGFLFRGYPHPLTG